MKILKHIFTSCMAALIIGAGLGILVGVSIVGWALAFVVGRWCAKAIGWY